MANNTPRQIVSDQGSLMFDDMTTCERIDRLSKCFVDLISERKACRPCVQERFETVVAFARQEFVRDLYKDVEIAMSKGKDKNKIKNESKA